jgi:hypothetical protein
MAAWGVFLSAVILMACAGKPAAQQAAAMSDEPPPKGAPQPRLGQLPPPPPSRANETADENERRFPINEYQLRREREKRAALQVTGRVEVKGSDNAHACEGLASEEKIECPLRDPRAIQSITDLPRGVRVTLKPGTVAPEKLQQMFACQLSLAAARPQTSGACGFLDARTEVEVNAQAGRLEVELERSAEVDRLRQQVRAALSAKK